MTAARRERQYREATCPPPVAILTHLAEVKR